MKKSDLASVIREEFLTLVKETTSKDMFKDMTPEDIKLYQDVQRLKHTGRTLDDEREAAERKKKEADERRKGLKVSEDRKAKEYVMSIEDEEEREEERKRMFGSDEAEKLTKEEMDDDEMDKAASKGAGGKDAKGVAAQATAALKAQTKKKAVSAFMDKMKSAGVVSDSNKILDAGKYKEEFAKFKASL